MIHETGTGEWQNPSPVAWYINLPLKGLTQEQWQCLTAADSLTIRLQKMSHNALDLRLQKNGWSNAYPEERLILPSLESDSKVWIREIVHCVRQRPWVWTRTVIPVTTIENTNIPANTSQSIGTFLFSDSNLKRSPFLFCILPYTHPYYQSFQSCCPKSAVPLWTRCSTLLFKKFPLLIIETFLPDFFLHVK